MQKCVFICDDDADILDICQMILEGDGKTIVTCNNADSLLHSLTAYTPNLIFIDNGLIGISGQELIRNLKNDEKYKEVPVLLFSATADIEKMAASAGADGYLAKPFDIVELKKTVDSYLQ